MCKLLLGWVQGLVPCLSSCLPTACHQPPATTCCRQPPSTHSDASLPPAPWPYAPPTACLSSCCREGLHSCASLDALIAALRRPLRLDEALDVELWMLDPGGACLLVGPTLPPAAVLEAAAGLVLHVRL